MIPEAKLKISLKEMSLKGTQILAQRSATTFAQAFQQSQRLKQTSKVNSSSKRAGKALRTLQQAK